MVEKQGKLESSIFILTKPDMLVSIGKLFVTNLNNQIVTEY